MTDFLPGRRLPNIPTEAQERQLYHAHRSDGEGVTMTVENGVWQWRRLRGGEGADAYGSGGWSAMQAWLGGKN